MEKTQVKVREIPTESKEKNLHSEGCERPDQLAQSSRGISVL